MQVINYFTSASWDLAISTSVLAAGWMMSNSFMIVAPSFEIVAFPENKIKNSRNKLIAVFPIILQDKWAMNKTMYIYVSKT